MVAPKGKLGCRKGKALGQKRWAIAEGYLPAWSNGKTPEMASHETFCVLNTGDYDAHLKVTIYFSDREPAGPFEQVVPARRTKHFRFNELGGGKAIPLACDFSSLIESDQPIVVQHTRMDSRQAENALMSSIAYAG